MKTRPFSKTVMTLASLACVATGAMAQTPAAPESSLAYNIGVVSEYRYRGLAQSRFQPAVQGGVDYTDKSGFYVGAWASQIKWIADNSTDLKKTKGDIELDLYGGYKFSLGDVAMDVGYLRYQYLNNTLANSGAYKNANTDEVYAAGTFGPFTLKYSYALSDLFGQYNFDTNKSSKGSDYVDLNATFDLGNGFTLVPQVGRQTVKNISGASYTHYTLTLNKDMGSGWAVSAAFHETDAKSYYALPAGAGSKAGTNAGKSALVLGVKYTF
ncbi:MAG: hypothetical protein RLZZ123_1122 [Pseudomonadota bacterium]|jgi:uncharacterized protein (TIGR02001 family)